MEWPEFLESSNSQKPTFDTFSAVPYNNRGVSAQAYQWTPEEKQFFENTFSRFNDLGSQTFFEYVASKLPHKSMEEIKNHYITLFKDVEIENHVPKNEVVVVVADDNQHYQLSQDQDDSSDMEAATNRVQPQVENIRPRRRRGIPWTEEEHQLFLMGLNRFGKGDWKSISRYYVVSKTPTQVASHAQKYFSRRNSTTPAERRRPSINDIQTVTLNPRTPTTIMNMTHPVNNDRLAYTNNYQVGSSSPPFRYPNNTFSGPTFSNNSNKDFGRFVNRGETSSISSFIMGQNNSTNNNNNNLRRPVSPRPFLSMYLSSAKKKNHGV